MKTNVFEALPRKLDGLEHSGKKITAPTGSRRNFKKTACFFKKISKKSTTLPLR